MLPTPDADLPVSALPGADSASASSENRASAMPGCESEKFSLSSSSSGTRVRMRREQLDVWAALYGTEHRQLRRWVKQGDAHADACPLDTPHAMPAWWSRNMRHQVPAKILAAARAHPAPAPSPVVEPVSSSTHPTLDPAGETLILRDMIFAKGEEVRQCERLVAAAYGLLESAYARPGGDVDLLQRRWEKACEIHRRAVLQQEELLKRRRELIPREAVLRDIATACELLRQTRESMVRQVLELSPLLDPPAREQVTRAVETVREKEERVFRNLDALKRPADVLQLLDS